MFENTISYTKLTNIDLDSDLMLKMNENVKLSFNNKKIILIFFFFTYNISYFSTISCIVLSLSGPFINSLGKSNK